MRGVAVLHTLPTESGCELWDRRELEEGRRAKGVYFLKLVLARSPYRLPALPYSELQ